MRAGPRAKIENPSICPAPMESFVGQTVSHYAFLEKLGSGGMGEIYKARDSRLNRIVAVKVLAPGRTRDPQRRRRFIQEARAASALNHPNIVTIHDILPEGDTQYMVMEHVSGETLHRIVSTGRLPIPQVLQIAIQMANALAAAHQAGIIHRDFKPANVMVTGSGLVKILDFGLAKLVDPTAPAQSIGPDSSDGGNDPTLTQAPITMEGAIMGTVNYMSPEQAEGLKVDARSDIFSFGAVLYEMVTGQRAFDGDSGVVTLSKVLRDEVTPIREVAPDVPADLDDLITRCLKKSPEARWQSMSEVVAALNTLRLHPEERPVTVASEPAPAPAEPLKPMAEPAPRPRKLWALLATCAVVLVCGIAASWWQMHRGSSTPAPAANTAVAPPAAAPPPTPSQPEPQPAATPEPAPTPAPDSTLSAAPPPRSTPPLPLATNSKPLPPPTVASVKPQIKPAAAATALPAPAVASATIPRVPAQGEAVTVTLTDGLPFRIALADDVPLDAEVGQPLRFRVIDGLEGGPVTVIAKGAIVTGAVAALGGKRNFFGERSKVTFRLISAASVDDGKISVRATPAAKAPETRPFVTPTESARDLKERSLIAASGTEYVAYIAGDQTLTVHK